MANKVLKIGNKVLSIGGGSTGETWVINETPLPLRNENFQFNVSFISNNISCTGMNFSVAPLPPMMEFGISFISYGAISGGVYNAPAGWTNQAYRTVTFSTPPTGDLLTWLQANAVKQTSNASQKILTTTTATEYTVVVTTTEISLSKKHT